MGSFLRQLKRRWILVTLFLGVVAVAAFFYQRQQAITKGTATYVVKETYIQDMLSLSGEVNAQDMATLRFQTSGRLAWVGVKEGDYVKKGQAIASLDVRDVNAKLTQYLNTYAVTRDEYDQSVDDNLRDMNEGATQLVRDQAKRLLEEAQYDLNNSVLAVQIHQLAIEYATLYSPIEGIVVDVSSPLSGVNVTPSQAEFIIIDPNTLYFSATADQTDVVNLSEGMVGELILDSYPDSTFTGEIQSISFTPDSSETGTVYRVKVLIAPFSAGVRMNMTGDINFGIGPRRPVLQVPTTAIISEQGNDYVMLDMNGNKVKTVVETGDVDGEMIEIISGLKKGDLVYD